MQADQIREALEKDPFRPFCLRFGSGKRIDIANPGLVAVSKSGRTAFAFHPHDDGWEIIETMLVEAIEYPPSKRNGHRKRK